MNKKIIPIILCGGSGSRLLPFLKKKSPKQFLNIINKSYNLLQQTLLRFVDNKIFSPPIIIASREHKNLVKSSIEEINISIHTIILEPTRRNTGPAIAAALSLLTEMYYDEDTKIFIAPIDHYIDNIEKFNQRITNISNYFENSNKKLDLISFFVKPKTVESNYGHLIIGDNIYTTDKNI